MQKETQEMSVNRDHESVKFMKWSEVDVKKQKRALCVLRFVYIRFHFVNVFSIFIWPTLTRCYFHDQNNVFR